MKFLSTHYIVSFHLSKELLKHIIRESGESKDDIIFNLLNALDHKFTRRDIDQKLKKRKNFGTFKVLDYPNTHIKVKCTIGFNHDGSPAARHNLYISMTPQTGQWLRMDDTDVKRFLKDKENAVTDSILLGSGRSSIEVPSWVENLRALKKKEKLQELDRLSQLPQLDRIPPAVSTVQASGPPSSGSSAHTSSAPTSSSPSDPSVDSSGQS